MTFQECQESISRLSARIACTRSNVDDGFYHHSEYRTCFTLWSPIPWMYIPGKSLFASHCILWRFYGKTNRGGLLYRIRRNSMPSRAEPPSPLSSPRLFVSGALHYPHPILITFASSCMRRSLCHRSLKELFMGASTNDPWTEGFPTLDSWPFNTLRHPV